jgi:hypothetical protein
MFLTVGCPNEMNKLSFLGKNDPSDVFYDRRGPEGTTDMLYFYVEALRTGAYAKLALHKPLEAIELLQHEFLTERENQELMQLPKLYHRFLNIITEPSFTPLADFMGQGNFLPIGLMRSLAYFVIAKASLETNSQEALEMLRLTSEYFISSQQIHRVRFGIKDQLMKPILQEHLKLLLKSYNFSRMKFAQHDPKALLDVTIKAIKKFKATSLNNETREETTLMVIEAALKALAMESVDEELCLKIKSNVAAALQENHSLDSTKTSFLQKYESALYLILADASYKLGDLHDFILNTVASIYEDINNKGTGSVDTVKKSFDKIMEQLHRQLQLTENGEEPPPPPQEVLDFLDNEYKILEQLAAPSYERGAEMSCVPSLKQQIKEKKCHGKEGTH